MSSVGGRLRHEMASEAGLEKSFRTRYWAAQHRHVAAALHHCTGTMLERTKKAIAHSRALVQSGSKDSANQRISRRDN